jgi:hypothetical protein
MKSGISKACFNYTISLPLLVREVPAESQSWSVAGSRKSSIFQPEKGRPFSAIRPPELMFSVKRRTV